MGRVAVAAEPGTRSPTRFLEAPARPAVAYVVQAEDYSGAEISHAPLLRADPEALVICPPGSRSEAFAHSLGAATAPLPFRPLRHSGGWLETLRSIPRGLATARRLRRLLRELPAREIVYCISLRPGLVAALAAIGLRRRIVWYLTDFLPPGPIGPLARLLARVRCDRAVAISRCVAEEFAGRSRRLAERTTVVHPGISAGRFPPAAAPGAPRAALVGYVSPVKRTDLAVEIAARVLHEVPDFRLSILGRAQYRSEDFALERSLRERVASDPKLSRAVSFPGYATDVAAELRHFGLLLHCRPDEPFGIALIEAMASGLPVVAPAAAGPLEIVEHGVTGFLYPPGDAEAAARHVIGLVRDAPMAARMGSAGRLAVERRFSEERQLAELEGVLAAAASGLDGSREGAQPASSR